jgi:hypothetical protein
LNGWFAHIVGDANYRSGQIQLSTGIAKASPKLEPPGAYP